MKELILATGNPGKLAELQAMLSPICCISQKSLGIEDAEETGFCFVENALLKARHASQLGSKAALADDSGLVVPALYGEPGIFSARYAGPLANSQRNNELLLKRMEGLVGNQRRAYFYCAIVVMQNPKDPMPLIALGSVEGLITLQPKGLEGFGYDPIFYLEEYQCTAAELPPQTKNAISHRGRALQQIKQQLSSIYLAAQ